MCVMEKHARQIYPRGQPMCGALGHWYDEKVQVESAPVQSAKSQIYFKIRQF